MKDLAKNYDGLLLVAFGGPETLDDIEPFLTRVTAGRPIPAERLAEVAERYRSVNGLSPINGRMRTLLTAVSTGLKNDSIDLPVFWGNRNAPPLLADAVAEMRDAGVQRALAWIGSPYSSYSSCRQYLEDLAMAREEVGLRAPVIAAIRRHHDHPTLIQVAADRLAEALNRLPAKKRDSALVLFSAHSIPTSLAATCDYVPQLNDVARLVAKQVDPDGQLKYEVVWQSRSGSPQVPWLEPDVGDRIEALGKSGTQAIVISPIGFPVENFEIQWDLDVEAAQRAEVAGIAFQRAEAVDNDPRFAEMVIDLVKERLNSKQERLSLGSLGVWPDTCPEICCPPPGIPEHRSKGL